MGAFIAQKSYIRMNSVCVPEGTTEITFSSILFTGISRKCEKKRFVYFYCYGLCLCYAIILAIIVLAAVIGARKSQERKDLKLKKIFQFPVSIFPFPLSVQVVKSFQSENNLGGNMSSCYDICQPPLVSFILRQHPLDQHPSSKYHRRIFYKSLKNIKETTFIYYLFIETKTPSSRKDP